MAITVRSSIKALVILISALTLLTLPFGAFAHDDDAAEEEQAFISIRQYDGVEPGSWENIAAITGEGFLPIISAVDGFIAYFLMSDGEELAAVTIFDTPENATASNLAAADFVAENLAAYLPNAPTITEGLVSIWHMAPLAEMDGDMAESDEAAEGEHDDDAMDDMDDGVSALHGGLRVYANFDVANADEATAITESGFLPIQQEAEGFFGYLVMYNEDGALGALSIYDNAENAAAVKDKAAAFVAENLLQYLPDSPYSMDASIGVAALAGYQDGANLIGDDMDGEGEG